ncbi:MAG: response regulator [Sphingobacteriales bacterium]|nr:MAG: response regulator [Sphingobacteriales bacterium]
MTETAGKIITALIVDDEPEACRNLASMLREYVPVPINICGFANDSMAAMELIAIHNPDVLFLDINMPGKSGLQFLEDLPERNFEVVFVTAYDEYAIKAFRLNAIDYVLKPLSITDLQDAACRISERISGKRLLREENGHLNHVINNLKKKKNKTAW